MGVACQMASSCSEYSLQDYCLLLIVIDFVKKVLQLNCKTQLMERDALNQQHVTQCYAIALIKSRRSLLVVGKTTG